MVVNSIVLGHYTPRRKLGKSGLEIGVRGYGEFGLYLSYCSVSLPLPLYFLLKVFFSGIIPISVHDVKINTKLAFPCAGNEARA